MTEKEHKIDAICKVIGQAVKAKVDAFAAEVKTMRTRELRKSQNLAKNTDLCPLCGNADLPDSCVCLGKTAGAPMAMAEGIPSAPKAPGAKGSAPKALGKALHPEAQESLHAAKIFGGQGKALDAGGKERAFVKKPAGTDRRGPSSVDHVNAELKGFKSIASNPTAMPSGAVPTDARPKLPRAPVGKSIFGSAAKGTVRHNGSSAVAKPGSSAKVGADLAADKKAGGVGFLNSLVAKFKGIGAGNWSAPSSGGVRTGMARTASAAFALSEKPTEEKKDNDLGNCVMCSKNEHMGTC